MIELFIYAVLLVFFIALIINKRRTRSSASRLNEMSHTASAIELLNEPALIPASSTGNRIRKGEGPYKILIADDQPAIRTLLAEAFQTYGFIVSEAANGREAIEKFQGHPVDFILLDLKMPEIDGIEALRAIRSMNQEVKAVMISAYGDPEKMAEARRLGVDRIFTKPFDIERLCDYVKKQLSL